MKTQVHKKLEMVFSFPLLQFAGRPTFSEVKSVASWSLAMEHRNSKKWENCRLMARNALDAKVERISWERSQEWNPLVRELRPMINSFLVKTIPRTSVPEEFWGKIREGLCWDILGICLEQAYTDLVEPVFYLPLLEPWYAAGHFPCGWEGEEFPTGWDGVIGEGRLIVF